MAAELFVDSSAWYTLARSGHPDHARLANALRSRISAGVQIVTSNLIVAESHALIMVRSGVAPALQFLNEVRLPPNLIVTSDLELESQAIGAWITRFGDQEFSLTDAVSFEIMKMRRIQEALTLDHHFAVAGFTIIPS